MCKVNICEDCNLKGIHIGTDGSQDGLIRNIEVWHFVAILPNENGGFNITQTNVSVDQLTRISVSKDNHQVILQEHIKFA
jgi:hypothetical protein